MVDVADFEAAEMVAGPIGPDSLRLPGAPERIRQAVQDLHDLVGTLDRTSQQLKQANPRGDSPGKVVRALSHVAQRTGGVLDSDTDTLRDLAGALDHEGDVLRDAQSATLPELRSRWHAARVDLTEAVERDAREGGQLGGGGGHGGGGHGGGGHGGTRVAAEPLHDGQGGQAWQSVQSGQKRDAHQLARHLDGQVLDDYEHLFRRWLGSTFRDPGDGAAHAQVTLVGGALDEGMQRYRHTVRSILEDFSDALRRVEGADQQVAEKLHRKEHDVLSAKAFSPGAEPATGVSSPDEVERLSQELQDASGSLRGVDHALDEIRLNARGGRMLPSGERVGSNDGFRRDWAAHFDELKDNLDKVRHHSDTVLRRIQQLEEEGAHDIRRAGRADG